MVERERAQRLLNILLDALADLKRYGAQVTAEELRDNRDSQNMVLYALYVAVQSAIDLGFHIASSQGLPRPATYQQVFLELGEAKTLEAEAAKRLAAWAGLRNVVAHQYPIIDFSKVEHALRNDLGDLEEFARVVAKILASA